MKRARLGRLATVLAVSLASVVAGAVNAPTASAAEYGCNGSVIDSWNNVDGGVTYATTYLYWDGTYNCVAAVKRGAYYGVRSRIAVHAWTDATGYVPPGDDGNYLYYANFSFYGRNRCIAVETDIWTTSGRLVIQDHVPSSGWFHCG
ncbi:hypothetical protein [Streptomyces sp. NPDC049881]|uniref:hypothetical protein n=1 Tax=Streptomyces sp. NPDC049881 TaxID=3155778 RepID=UPI00341A6B01